MKYVKHYVQKTVKTTKADEFDEQMNLIYLEAAKGGKEPEIHFFDREGFCASIKYFVSLTIPETISEEYELRGEGAYCPECPYFIPPQDKRFKRTTCSKTMDRTNSDARACDIFYREFRENKDGKNQNRAI